MRWNEFPRSFARNSSGRRHKRRRALWAGLIARINQGLGKPAGFINPLLYATANATFRDKQGNNGDYKAGTGWDACTGLGTPNGQSLLQALTS